MTDLSAFVLDTDVPTPEPSGVWVTHTDCAATYQLAQSHDEVTLAAAVDWAERHVCR